LEAIRLDRSAFRDGRFDIGEADQRYCDAFQGFGLDVLAVDPNPAVERIRASAVKGQLLAALDDWLAVRAVSGRGGSERVLAVAQGADADAWRRRLRAAFWQRDMKALKDLAGDKDLSAQSPATVVLLGNALFSLGDSPRAATVLAAAQQQHPHDFWINHSLAFVLVNSRPAQPGWAVGYYRAALAVRPDSAGAQLNLGYALLAQGERAEAAAAFRRAVALQPGWAEAHFNLGVALHAQGDRAGATAFGQAAALKPDWAEAHFNLGVALYAQGDQAGAAAAYRQAIALKPNYAEAHNALGIALHAQGDRAGAVAAYRQAITQKTDWAEAYFNLGNSLREDGDQAGAATAFRRAIALRPGYSEAHCNLGNVLRRRGEFREALAALRRGRELGTKDPRWRYTAASAGWVRRAERLVELDGQLPAFLEGTQTPASAAARIELAQICSYKRLHRAASRFYEEAFADGPDLQADHRYDAARAAALAGCGWGEDAAKLDDGERARLRAQAHDWLRDELARWVKQLADNPPALRQKLGPWQRDPELAGVRDSKPLAALPPAERERWFGLWVEVTTVTGRSALPSGISDK
jgi:Flp pilus assembly protein TadD